MDILLFPGYKVPKKRYNNFIDHIHKRFDSFKHQVHIVDLDQQIVNSDQGNECKVYIVAHSLGIIRAIIYCETYGLLPDLIISMDGSYLDYEIIRSHLCFKEEELARIYQTYLDLPRTLNLRIGLFRQEKNFQASDESHYSFIQYYNQTGHEPYDHRGLRTKILNSIDLAGVYIDAKK